MKLPLSWLTSMVDVDLPVDDLVAVMSLNGLEVEEVTRPGAGAVGVATARVTDVRAHPDADALRLVRVTGADGEVEVVCGAANFAEGDVVVHAPPGASLPPPPGSDEPLVLEARRIRGVVSQGMLASPRELRLGDDHEGLLVLPEGTPVGVDLSELIPLGEPVIEIAVQPDRGDQLSVLGVARDLAAILDTSWQAPTSSDPVDGRTLPVTLETSGCERFATWVLSGVRVGSSPAWLRHRLAQCGMRSIDVVVDVTNYVMLELGEPLHAFDLGSVRGPSLTVRDARGGEQLVTLDGQERTLEAGDLVIEDSERPVSLAGVMGGLDTEVTAGTTEVLLEAAVWEPLRIRATSRRLGLVSEASQRFERGVDPEGAERAVARAADLLRELAGGQPTGTDVVRTDPQPSWASRPPVTVDTDRVARLLGLELPAEEQAQLLRRSGSDVQAVDASVLEVTPPSWRGDLQRTADVAEEVARLRGYDAIPSTLPVLPVTGGLTPTQRLEREARSAALAGGFHEAVSRPFVGTDALPGLLPSDGRVVLANPLAKDASAMRPSLVEGLLQAVRRNVGQGRAGTALVELGRLFRPVDDPVAEVLDVLVEGDWRWRAPDGGPLPVQPRALALAAQGLRMGDDWLDPELHWSVHDLLAVLDEVGRRLAPPGAASGSLQPGAVPSGIWRLERAPVEREGLHPGRTAVLLLDGQEVGVVGQLHPHEAERRDLPEPVIVGELLLEPFLLAVPSQGHPPIASAPLVRHPAVSVDVALVAPDELPYARLEQAVRAGAGELLDGLWQFDEYRGEQAGEGARSVAIRLRLQAPDRQLTDEDAERVIESVAEAAGEVGASLRR